MPQTSPELALVANPPSTRREAVASCRDTGPGWFDSSWELQRGLEVREGWSDDDRLHGWIETFLLVQRAAGRTASPSASTAIA